jgi:hypothetical protein
MPSTAVLSPYFLVRPCASIIVLASVSVSSRRRH